MKYIDGKDSIDLIDLLSKTDDPEKVHLLIDYMSYLDNIGELHILQQKKDAEIMDEISHQHHVEIVEEYNELLMEKKIKNLEG